MNSMIPKETLIATIDQFDEVFSEVTKQCKEAKEALHCHLEYYKMQKAWAKFQDAVEFKLLPFTEQP